MDTTEQVHRLALTHLVKIKGGWNVIASISLEELGRIDLPPDSSVPLFYPNTGVAWTLSAELSEIHQHMEWLAGE